MPERHWFGPRRVMTSLKGHARPLWSPHIGNRQISIIDSYLESHILTFSESESQISRLSIPHTLISALYILTSSGDDFCPKSVSITSVDGAVYTTSSEINDWYDKYKTNNKNHALREGKTRTNLEPLQTCLNFALVSHSLPSDYLSAATSSLQSSSL